VQTLDQELKRSMAQLKGSGKIPLYYLAYRLYEGTWEAIIASDGALDNQYPHSHWRMLSVDLRIGSPRFDNTHFLRGANTTSPHFYERSSKTESILPLDDAGIPLRQCLWLKTDEAFKEAQQRFSELTASKDILSIEEDKSGDFTLLPAHHYDSPIKVFPVDRPEWEERVRKLSKLFLSHPAIQNSTVSFAAQPTTRYMVNSENSQLIEQHTSYQILIRASTLANDGMKLWLWDSVESTEPSFLPDQAGLTKRVEKLAKSLDELRNAPAAEPYVGPAILSGKAAAVFFHETFGHRIEAVHEKSENEGKTFARKLGTIVMPSFISVVDDPTVLKSGNEFLNGHYAFDDEGVPAQRVILAKNGILTGFLLSRSPVQGFKSSNGHGRSAPGWNPMARQANLFVRADKSKEVSPQNLKLLLIAEAKKQHKSYGLVFDEISGGSTYTAAGSEQTYSIYPLKVYKVFVDGRPDQLIRGAEIVGTPLAALEKIMAAGTDTGVFNGSCGRESGYVPVSAVSPSLLIQSIETKRTAKTFEKLPILPDPTSIHKAETPAAPTTPNR
jgi:TldD protein